MKLALLSNVNLDILARSLSKSHEVYLPRGYGAWRQEAYDPSQIAAFGPEAVAVLLDGSSWLHETGPEAFAAEMEAAMACIGALARALPGAELMVSTLDLRPEDGLATDALPAELTLTLGWEKLLGQSMEANPRVHRFDLAGLIREMGRERFYSDKLWYLGSQPYDIRAMDRIRTELNDMLSLLHTPRKKLLAVDLDNTLWGGAVGEEGLEGVELGLSHTGAIYRDAQLAIRRLKEAGVLLAAVSKNNESDALPMLESHPQMVLKKEDFVSLKINWDLKSANLQSLSQELSLGLDSFVFLDDNPAERAEVASALPQVTVADFPEDISRLPALIQELGKRYFRSFRLTGEDMDKTEQYRSQAERSALKRATGTMEEYLRSLSITAELGVMTPGQLERVSQLTNKTNQFNLLTRRMSAGEVTSYIDSGGLVFTASAADRYGDSGLIFVCMVSRSGRTARIDNLLMSCRVMGRRLEHALLTAIENRLAGEGVTTLLAAYEQTKKNAPVAELYDSLGFARVGETETRREYALDLSSAPFAAQSVISLSWKE